MPVSSRGPPQVIDTVPMDESTEEMFRYFEPLYEVIHDMPRPPESFFKRKGGEWGRCAPTVPGASLPSVLPCWHCAPAVPGLQLHWHRHRIRFVPRARPEGARDGHSTSHRPCRGCRGLFGQPGVPLCDTAVPLCDTLWAFSPQNFEAGI